jgi:nucleoside-diphosphate-sugar epimerase
MNILVTGGAGYIGSILVPDLLSQGHTVTVLDNFMFKQSSLNHICAHKNFNIVNGDIRKEEVIKPLLKQADVVIPLAALVGAPLCNKDDIAASTTNYHAIGMMLQNVHKSQIILMPTTNSAYGSGDENNFCTEETPLNPISSYAIAKVAVEQELIKHENAVSFRLATVFGMSPRMRTDLLVNDLTYRAVYDGSVVLFESHFKRNYIHVRDISRVFTHAINNIDKMKGEIYNVGLSSANVSKMELCEKIKEHIPQFSIMEAPIRKDPDQRNYIVSNAKLEATGFQTQFTLDDGIVELIKGYQMIKNSIYGNI